MNFNQQSTLEFLFFFIEEYLGFVDNDSNEKLYLKNPEIKSVIAILCFILSQNKISHILGIYIYIWNFLLKVQ